MRIFRLNDGFFFLWFGLIAIVGLFTPYEYNHLPVIILLDGIVFLLAVRAIFLFGIPRHALFFIVTLSLYLLLSFVYAVFIVDAHLLDYLQAYKAFFYFLFLSFFAGKSLATVDIDFLVSFFYFIISVFLVKYTYSLFLNLTPRMGERPGLFVENNFELIFLLIYFYLVSPFLKRRLFVFVILLSIVLMSGSRSIALALCFVYFFTFVNRLDWRLVVGALGFIPILYLVSSIFISRMDISRGLESIDRFNFMLHFINEVNGWPWWKFLFGSLPLTPMSYETCLSLKAYDSLYSYSGDGSCYSVILHSYFLRVIFDHGIAGLFFLTFALFWFLKIKGFSFKDFLCILGVLYVSALSVSSFNSVFVAASMLLIMISKNAHHRTPYSLRDLSTP